MHRVELAFAKFSSIKGKHEIARLLQMINDGNANFGSIARHETVLECRPTGWQVLPIQDIDEVLKFLFLKDVRWNTTANNEFHKRAISLFS